MINSTSTNVTYKYTRINLIVARSKEYRSTALQQTNDEKLLQLLLLQILNYFITKI